MSGYQVDTSAQFVTAILAASVGMGLCLVYDLMRILRYAKRPTVISAFFGDIVWWLVSAAATYILMLVRCSGTPRIYVLISEAVGFCCCRFTLSVLIMRAAKPTVDLIRRCTGAVKRSVFLPLERWSLRIFKKSAVFSGKFLFSVKILLKHTLSVVYNHLKSSGKRRTDDESTEAS